MNRRNHEKWQMLALSRPTLHAHSAGGDDCIWNTSDNPFMDQHLELSGVEGTASPGS